MARDCIWPGGLTSCDLYCSAGGRNWPIATDEALTANPLLSGYCGHRPIFIAQRSVANDPGAVILALQAKCFRYPLASLCLDFFPASFFPGSVDAKSTPPL